MEKNYLLKECQKVNFNFHFSLPFHNFRIIFYLVFVLVFLIKSVYSICLLHSPYNYLPFWRIICYLHTILGKLIYYKLKTFAFPNFLNYTIYYWYKKYFLLCWFKFECFVKIQTLMVRGFRKRIWERVISTVSPPWSNLL